MLVSTPIRRLFAVLFEGMLDVYVFSSSTGLRRHDNTLILIVAIPICDDVRFIRKEVSIVLDETHWTHYLRLLRETVWPTTAVE